MRLLKTIVVDSAIIHVWQDSESRIILGGFGWYEYFDYEKEFSEMRDKKLECRGEN